MKVTHFTCRKCKRQYHPESNLYICDCGGSLDIEYDLRILKSVTWNKLRKLPGGQWRYRVFYPKIHDNHLLTRNEGCTPLVQSKQKKLLFKCEFTNNTGSFKDRGSTVELTIANHYRVKKIVCASTGNMGTSVAAYAALGNMHATIIVPSAITKEKEFHIKQYGATIKKIKGDYTKAAKIAKDMATKNNYYLVGDYAYRGEGEKGLGYELMDQSQEQKLKISNIVVPIGNGTLLSSIWRSLQEMKYAKLISSLPKLYGVQAAGCNPCYKAWVSHKRNKSKKEKHIEIIEQKARTVATAIACGDPSDGDKAVRAVIESKGEIITVTDKKILSARKHLATEEGLDVEPSGAVSYAGFKKLQLTGNTVFILTGHGLKDQKHT